MTKKKYVDGCVNWLDPLMVRRTAIPKALMAMTLIEPTKEQIVTYTIGLVLPHRGTALHIISIAITITSTAYTMNPGCSMYVKSS